MSLCILWVHTSHETAVKADVSALWNEQWDFCVFWLTFSLNKPSFLEKVLKIFTWNLNSDCIETCILEVVLSPPSVPRTVLSSSGSDGDTRFIFLWREFRKQKKHPGTLFLFALYCDSPSYPISCYLWQPGTLFWLGAWMSFSCCACKSGLRCPVQFNPCDPGSIFSVFQEHE